MAGVLWLLLWLLFGVAIGVAVVVVVVAVVLEVDGGGDRGQLVVACCKGGLEDLRTLVWELELELEEAEAEDEEVAQTEAEPDDDDDEEEEEQQLVAPDILAAVEEVEAEVIGRWPTTCMGCGGGDSGERLCEERLRGVATGGGGDSGISTMGLGERLGTKSDCPVERKMPLRTGQGAWLGC